MEPPLPPFAMGGQMDDTAPLPIVLLVLQVSPLPESADQEEFFYDPSPDVQNGPFATAQEFFLAQGHGVIIFDCPDVTAFQAVHPSGASFNSIAALPPCVFTEEYARLQELALAAIAVATVVAVANDAPNNVVWERLYHLPLQALSQVPLGVFAWSLESHGFAGWSSFWSLESRKLAAWSSFFCWYLRLLSTSVWLCSHRSSSLSW
jgi:hypothetical protein